MSFPYLSYEYLVEVAKKFSIFHNNKVSHRSNGDRPYLDCGGLQAAPGKGGGEQRQGEGEDEAHLGRDQRSEIKDLRSKRGNH